MAVSDGPGDGAGGGRPPWGRMYEARLRVRKRFPDPLGLPLVKRPETLLAARLRKGDRLLDVGAGDGSLGEKLRREGAEVAYVPMNPEGGAGVRSLEEAPGPFEAACLLEVVEHLSPDAGMDLLRKVRDRLGPGGLLILSTPNVFKPGQFLLDATHRTPYVAEELGALVEEAGFVLEGLFRVYNASLLARFAHIVLFRPLHRFLGVDFARSVMAVGRKP